MKKEASKPCKLTSGECSVWKKSHCNCSSFVSSCKASKTKAGSTNATPTTWSAGISSTCSPLFSHSCKISRVFAAWFMLQSRFWKTFPVSLIFSLSLKRVSGAVAIHTTRVCAHAAGAAAMQAMQAMTWHKSSHIEVGNLCSHQKKLVAQTCTVVNILGPKCTWGNRSSWSLLSNDYSLRFWVWFFF